MKNPRSSAGIYPRSAMVERVLALDRLGAHGVIPSPKISWDMKYFRCSG